MKLSEEGAKCKKPRAKASYNTSDVVDDYSSHSTSVVHWSQAMIPLLTSSIPYLKLDRYIINDHCL